MTTIANNTNGNRKWNMKNLCKDALDIVKEPEINSIIFGKGDNRFVITVAPQKLICP